MPASKVFYGAGFCSLRIIVASHSSAATALFS